MPCAFRGKARGAPVYQLALVDPATGAIRSVAIRNLPADLARNMPEPFTIRSEDNERVWLSAGHEVLVEYSRTTGQARWVRPPWRAGTLRLIVGNAYWFPGGQPGTYAPRPGLVGPGLPEDLVLDPPSQVNAGQTSLLGLPAQPDTLAGLFEVGLGSLRWRKLGTDRASLPGRSVRGLAFDERRGRLYVATDGGLAVLSLPDHAVVGRIGRVDGLPSDDVASVTLSRNKLELTFTDVDRVATLDLDTGLVRRGAGSRDGANRGRGGSLHWLGGESLVDVTRGGKRYLGGENGLVILDGGAKMEKPAEAEVEVRQRLTPGQRWREDAKGTWPTLRRPPDLSAWLRHNNPFVRAQAVYFLRHLPAAQRAGYLRRLRGALADRDIQATALELLGHCDGPDVVPLLAELVREGDCAIAERATLELARRKASVDAALVRRMLPLATLNETRRLHGALAGTPTSEAITLLQSLRLDEFGEAEFRALGASLRRRHALLDDLLLDLARGAEWLSAEVIRKGGPSLLPLVGKALASPDLALAVGAARACKLLPEQAMIPLLRKALKRESQALRLAAIDALVTLKAREAVRDLVALLDETAEGEDVKRPCWAELHDTAEVDWKRLGGLAHIRDGRTDWQDGPRLGVRSNSPTPLTWKEPPTTPRSS
jgi:HEAT repeat protein